jgi:hypothetical protein
LQKYFDVEVTYKKAIMKRLGQLLRNYRMKLNQKYIVPNQETPSKLNERLEKYSKIMTPEEWAGFVTHTNTDEYKVLISHLY